LAIFDQRAARRLTKRCGGFRAGASRAGASAVSKCSHRRGAWRVRAKGVGRESGGLSAPTAERGAGNWVKVDWLAMRLIASSGARTTSRRRCAACVSFFAAASRPTIKTQSQVRRRDLLRARAQALRSAALPRVARERDASGGIPKTARDRRDHSLSGP